MQLACDTVAPTWATPTAYHLRPGRVAVYRLAVPSSGPVPGQHQLPAPELHRAARFHHPADRQRYLAARVLRRQVLGAYTGVPPAQVAFASTDTHKPYLPAAPGLHFSVAHAGAWVLLAVGSVAVGIDVEETHAAFDVQDLLHHHFSTAESQRIGQQPAARPLLLAAWTRKEALAKALGWGIDERFAALPGLPGRYCVPGPGQWQVSGFEVAAGYVGAVACPPGTQLSWVEATLAG